MILEKMPTGKLESLRAEVEAMIGTKIAERRRELESELSKLWNHRAGTAGVADAPSPGWCR